MPSVNNFSIEVSSKRKNRNTNPWLDEECKNSRIEINEAMEGPQNIDKIKNYKAVIKMKRRHYTIKRQDNLLHLSKVAADKFWSQILSR